MIYIASTLKLSTSSKCLRAVFRKSHDL